MRLQDGRIGAARVRVCEKIETGKLKHAPPLNRVTLVVHALSLRQASEARFFTDPLASASYFAIARSHSAIAALACWRRRAVSLVWGLQWIHRERFFWKSMRAHP